ncbi:MAG: hypothetical protein ETSY2_47020, partial [Candidatus Entotheonella gemina]
TAPPPLPSEPDDPAPSAPVSGEPSPDASESGPVPAAAPPVAHADSAATRPGTAVVIPVLANDRDLAGQRLSLSAVT